MIAGFAGGSRSAFNRYGIHDPDLIASGLKTCVARMSSHQPRHWINTVAHKSGLSAFLITVWMQRANPEHTLAYLHDTSDIANIVVGKLNDGTLSGRLTESLGSSLKETRVRILETVTTAHILEGVTYCVEPDAPDGCERKRACPGCDAWHFDSNDHYTRTSLLERRDQLRRSLAALEARTHGAGAVVARQHEVIEEQLAYLDEALNTGFDAAKL